jgi:hypothetical protein
MRHRAPPYGRVVDNVGSCPLDCGGDMNMDKVAFWVAMLGWFIASIVDKLMRGM